MHRIKKILFYTLLLLLSSCKFECNVGGSNSSSVTSTTKKIGDVTVTNNINITSNNTKLTSATLISDITNERVADDNVVALGEKINLRLFFNNDWKVINNRYYLGASEKIVTDNGSIVLNAADLFKDNTAGFAAEETSTVQLNAVITKQVKSIKYYIVYFKVWDKNSSAEVSGNYRFYIKG